MSSRPTLPQPAIGAVRELGYGWEFNKRIHDQKDIWDNRIWFRMKGLEWKRWIGLTGIWTVGIFLWRSASSPAVIGGVWAATRTDDITKTTNAENRSRINPRRVTPRRKAAALLRFTDIFFFFAELSRCECLSFRGACQSAGGKRVCKELQKKSDREQVVETTRLKRPGKVPRKRPTIKSCEGRSVFKESFAWGPKSLCNCRQ